MMPQQRMPTREELELQLAVLEKKQQHVKQLQTLINTSDETECGDTCVRLIDAMNFILDEHMEMINTIIKSIKGFIDNSQSK